MMTTTTNTPSMDSAPTLIVELDPADVEVADEPVSERLKTYGILPPGHRSLPESVLEGVERLFGRWYQLWDDDARRIVAPDLFDSESQMRRVLLAIVPLYHDPRFFDEATPTASLIEIALVAHAKWRRWLD